LRPLERLETREYILYRIHRSGGSGIFNEAALDRIFEYTRGVPRRINAWCDLAMVAGFAEGRHEIDAEFIDTVVAAQGGTLEEEMGESQEAGEGPIASQAQASGMSTNNLKGEIAELSGRLTRVEGMCIELSNHLIPLITDFFTNKEQWQAERNSPAVADEVQVVPEVEVEENATPPKSVTWWSRWWR
jgi:hypothetical protein